MAPLFRPESLQSRAQAWLGRPVVISRIPIIAFATFSIVFVVAIALFVTFADYTRRVRVSGIILPHDGLTRVAAPQSGWITDLRVEEGEQVRRGDVLYTLSIDVTTALGATQGAVSDILAHKRTELTQMLERDTRMRALDKQATKARLSDLQRELPQIDEQLRLLEATVSEFSDFAERQKDLMERGIAVSAEYEQRLRAFYAERAQLPALSREKVQAESRLNDLQAELAAFDLQSEAQAADIRRQILDIDQQISESEARREVAVTAPRDGTVTGIITLAGQTVTAGTPLLTIVPDNRPLVAQLLAPGSAIGFLREGMPVLLRYQAFPYQKFGQYPGEVTVISRANLGPEGIGELRGDSQDAPVLYRVTVQPQQPYVNAYGRTEELQAGMEVEAHLLVETRPLYQWVLEPIYGLRGAVSGGES